MCGREIEKTAPGRTTRELTIRQHRRSKRRSLSEQHTERSFFRPNILDLPLVDQMKTVVRVEEALASSDNVRE
jgi:hypothetical protein